MTVPLPVITANKIENPRPGVQELVNLFSHALNLTLQLDSDVLADPEKVAENIGERMQECSDMGLSVANHMATMQDPIPDLTSIFLLIIANANDQSAMAVVSGGVSFEVLDHLIAILTLCYTGIIDIYMTLHVPSFSLKATGGEFFG